MSSGNGAMADSWYYVRNGMRFGPFAFEQLRQLALSGLITTGDMVQDGTTQQWVSAGAVAGLAFPAAPAGPQRGAAAAPDGDEADASPPREPPEPERLRALLLQDLGNVALRRHYLAVRTPELCALDRGPKPGAGAEMRLILIFAATGGVLGLIVWVVSAYLAASDGPWNQRDVARGLAAVRDFGAAGTALVGGAALAAVAWELCEVARRTARVAGEIGPLPPDAPLSPSAARARFLGEGQSLFLPEPPRR